VANEIYLAENGQQLGPFSENQVREMIGQGRVQEGSYAWFEGQPDWKPIGEIMPELFAMTIAVSAASLGPVGAGAATRLAAPEPELLPEPASIEAPAAAAAQPANFELVAVGEQRQAKIAIKGGSAFVAAEALQSIRGDVVVEPTGVGWLCRGSGTLLLQPTSGECVMVELNGEEWALEPGAFLACDPSLSLERYADPTWAALPGAASYSLIRVAGHGKVLLHSPGPVEKIELKGETLQVFGPHAVAHKGALEFRLEHAPAASSDTLVRRFHGTGSVWLAPVKNR
jgi:hypothetical protein